jgi:hemerythrin-like domain-containing protein
LQGLTEALEVYVSALEAGQPLHEGDLRDLMHGFRTVADYRHFEKVEEVLIPVLVRNGFDYNLDLLDDGRREHDRVRYLIEVLHQSAERELNWNLDERKRIACSARNLVADQRRLATRQELELFPEIVTRLEPPVLGQLTEQLCQFDEQSASRGPKLDVSALSKSVFARYASTLPPARELTR